MGVCFLGVENGVSLQFEIFFSQVCLNVEKILNGVFVLVSMEFGFKSV